MNHRILVAFALALLVCGGSADAGLITFDDRAAFESRLAPGFFLEDFEDNRGSSAVTEFNDPLNQFSNNAAFGPGTIEPGLNLFVAGSPTRMVLLDTGFRGLASDVVGPGDFPDDLVVQLPNKGFAVGLDYLQLSQPDASLAGRVQVFNQPGALLGQFDLAITNEAQFFGVIATDLPIGALVFRDVDTVGELVDNVTFGSVVPEPNSAFLYPAFLGLACFRRRRRTARR